MMITHPDYGKLASRVVVSNLHKNTLNSFVDTMQTCYDNINPRTGKHAPQIDRETLKLVRIYKRKLEHAIDYSRDYEYSYFGVKTLTRAYLKKVFKDDKEVIVERPQHMLMRVALGIWKDNISMVIETYNKMSNREYTHATPTLFNAGTTNPQLSSCFLIANEEDSLDGIMNTAKEVSRISGAAGGVGISLHNIRAAGSYINGSGGVSNGLMPYLRTFNELSRYWDQGGGKRKGSFAMYLEPWHADVFTFLDIKKNHGKEEMRARDLFPALWIPDLFMKRVKEDAEWTLMCPNECPGLFDCYGEEFESLYISYEQNGKGRETIQARKLWEKILESQIETGTPYMLYKDAANHKSNQKNLGTIRSSNLCTEIIEYSDDKETAVCNLASISLPSCINIKERKFDHEKLREITRHTVYSLDEVIDNTTYPTKKSEISNNNNRPIGIGVQGLADVFAILKYAFNSEEARLLNKEIFETIYFSALEASCQNAIQKGVYNNYKDSPISKGILQYDMWDKTEEVESNSLWDWKGLKKRIRKHGVRNSLLVAPMPTASTSQILGNNECFEPFTSNLYLRRTLSGEFIVVNEYLLSELIEEGLWNDQVKNELKLNNGSIQNIQCIPVSIKERYQDAYEMSMKVIIDMAADRAIFIDQSQSMNLFMNNVTPAKLTSMHFYGWEKGLKTGMYYLRTKSAVDAIKFTVVKESVDNPLSKEELSNLIAQGRAAEENGEDCLMCGS